MSTKWRREDFPYDAMGDFSAFDFEDQEEEAELLRMTSQWDSGNAMLYFSFEKDPMESSFGMLWNDDKNKNYQTRSGSLYFNKIDDVIQEIIEFIIRVYNI